MLLHRVSKPVIIYSEDWVYLKSLNINISNEVRNFLHNLVASKEGNIDGINIKLERLKLEENMSKLSKIQAEISQSENLIKTIEETEKKQEEEQLNKEKERIENESKCPECGSALTPETSRQINNETILCRTCSITSEIVKKYMKVKK